MGYSGTRISYVIVVFWNEYFIERFGTNWLLIGQMETAEDKSTWSGGFAWQNLWMPRRAFARTGF